MYHLTLGLNQPIKSFYKNTLAGNREQLIFSAHSNFLISYS